MSVSVTTKTSIFNDGVDQYIQGDLVTSPSGDFTLIWKGSVAGAPSAGQFSVLFVLYDKSGSEYLGIALNNSSPYTALKIISNGKTPGSGSENVVFGSDHTIQLDYVASTNTATIKLDGVTDYSVNPTSGATWVGNLDGYRFFTAQTISSFAEGRIYDDCEYQDASNSSNNLLFKPSESTLGAFTLAEVTNGQTGTLINFDDFYLETEFTPLDVSGISYSPVQGVARDATHFYFFDSATGYDGTKADEIAKVTLAGSTSATNSTPYTSLPSGSWKMNDGCVDGGVIYVCPRAAATGLRVIARYNASDLSYISHTSINSNDDFGSSVCVGHTGNLFLPGFDTSVSAVTDQIAEYEKDGTFVQFHTISTDILEMQGITYDGTHYYISSSAPTNGSQSIWVLDTSFQVLKRYFPDTSVTELEGLEYYGGDYYCHDIVDEVFNFRSTGDVADLSVSPYGIQRLSQTYQPIAASRLNGVLQ